MKRDKEKKNTQIVVISQILIANLLILNILWLFLNTKTCAYDWVIIYA